MRFNTLDDHSFKGKTALIRVDINVPVSDGVVTDTSRIERIVPTVKHVLNDGGKVVLLSHFGRPKDGFDPEFSTAILVNALSDTLQTPVQHAKDCIGSVAQDAIDTLPDQTVLVLENTRFHKGEKANDPAFAKEMAKLGDIFVLDAFSSAHRAHASVVGIADVLPACAGRLMQEELTALEQALNVPQKPVLAVVGGAKVSTKIELLENLIKPMDKIVIGGGMANTFLAAQGVSVGKSLCEYDLLDTARDILAKAENANCEIILPIDVVVAREFAQNADHIITDSNACPDDMMILDAGPKSIELICEHIETCKTIVWNGPLGAFEITPFNKATDAAALKVAELSKRGDIMSVAGGGDTVAALNKSGAAKDFTYISTAGGAFLEWLEGKTLPGVAVLEKK